MNESTGHSLDEPEQRSVVSQVPSCAARHTVFAGRNWPLEQQKSVLAQTQPLANRQVGVQQASPLPNPGSHCSFPSTMPFPHWAPVTREGSQALSRQVLLVTCVFKLVTDAVAQVPESPGLDDDDMMVPDTPTWLSPDMWPHSTDGMPMSMITTPDAKKDMIYISHGTVWRGGWQIEMP